MTDLQTKAAAEHDAWVLAQLKAWPTRIHPERTTNIEYLMKEAAKRIEALQSEGWRTISEAPHNKAVLLGWADWRDGRWCMEVGAATTGERNEIASSISQHGSATHFMLLPAPPSKGSPMASEYL